MGAFLHKHKRCPRLVCGLLAFVAGLGAAAAWAQTIAVDMSVHQIRISEDFAGSEVTIFGAVDIETIPGARTELIVTVEGPPERITVRRKSRVAGIWANVGAVTFEQVPTFYFVASSAPLVEITTDLVRRYRRIEPADLRFPLGSDTKNLPEEAIRSYREALVRNMLDAGLFVVREGGEDGVVMRGRTLFRTVVPIPANAPAGRYQVETLLVRDGRVVVAQTHPLFLQKAGIGRFISELAYGQPFLYGVAAVIVALFTGWLTAVIFRKL